MIKDILNERQKTHGDFADNARVYQAIKHALDQGSGVTDDFTASALDMIAMKQARIRCGDPRFKDHWLDIIGYCWKVVERIEREQNEMKERME